MRFSRLTRFLLMTPTPYDHGSHAAVVLAGGILFQKGAWSENHPYEVTPEGTAMALIPTRFIPPAGEFLEPPDRTQYPVACYERGRNPRFKLQPPKISHKERNRYLVFFSTRLPRLIELAKTSQKAPPPEVTEMAKTVGEFERRYLPDHSTEKLLGIDRELAQAYLAAKSVLEWNREMR